MHLQTIQTLTRTRPAMEFDAVPVVMMAHALASHHGDTATLRLASFLKDSCGEDPRCHVFVIENGEGTIAGFAAGHFTYVFQNGITGFEIQNFFIRPEFRGLRLGHDLIRNVVAFAVKKGCKRIALGAHSANKDAINFYLRVGFERGNLGGDIQRFHLEGRKLNEFMEK